MDSTKPSTVVGPLGCLRIAYMTPRSPALDLTLEPPRASVGHCEYINWNTSSSSFFSIRPFGAHPPAAAAAALGIAIDLVSVPRYSSGTLHC